MYRDVRNSFNNGKFYRLPPEDKLIILNKYYPVGLVVKLNSSPNLWFVDYKVEKSKIIGYTDNIYDEEDDNNYTLLILEDSIQDDNPGSVADGTIHPVHINYDETELRDFKIKNLLIE